VLPLPEEMAYKAQSWKRRMTSSDKEPADTFTLEFPVYRTEKNKILFLMYHPVCAIVGAVHHFCVAKAR
jgi:hypothetical protein